MCPELSHIKEAQHTLRQMTRWLQTCPEHAVPDAYLEVLRTAEHLFGLKQQLMETLAFPIRQLHLEQHARVLQGLHCVHAQVMQGACDEGRHAGSKLLIDWLRLHNDTLDAAFDVWVDYCRNGMAGPEYRLTPAMISAH